MEKEKKTLRKVILIPIIVLLCIPILIGIIMAVGGSGSTSDYKVVLIKNELKISEEEATTVTDIIKQVGISNFTEIKHDELLDDNEGEGTKGYRIKTSFSDNIILYIDSSNKVIGIRWSDRDFYRNNEVLLNFNDFLMDMEEKTDYQIDAQKRIKELLKSPSSAKFPGIGEWKFAKDNGSVTLQAYVDSQNSYGATVRAEFQVVYSKEKVAISLILDDVEYIK